MPICSLPAQVVFSGRNQRGIGVAPSARDLAYGPNAGSRHGPDKVGSVRPSPQIVHAIQPEQPDVTLTGGDAASPHVPSGLSRQVTQQAMRGPGKNDSDRSRELLFRVLRHRKRSNTATSVGQQKQMAKATITQPNPESTKPN